MSDLLKLAEQVVELAGSGEQVEAYLTHAKTFSVKAYEGDVEALSSAEPRGAGVRVVADSRAGFAYTTDLTDDGLREALDQARANARFAGEDQAVGLAEAWSEPVPDVEGLFDPSHAEVTADEKVAFAIQLEAATKAVDSRVRTVEDAFYQDAEEEVAIATSTGISGSYRATEAWCYSVPIATDDDDTQVGFDFDLGRSLRDLDGRRTARRAAVRALSVLGASKIPSDKMPIVFDPYTAGQFLGVIAQVLTAESVQKGRSLFAGRLEQKVASDALTLIDDGRIAGAPGSQPWDAEGVPTQHTEIIKDGVLASYLYNLTSARREGRQSTGNASRLGFKSAPKTAPSNLELRPTGESREEVLRIAGRSLLVQDFHGVHSGANPISGDFSVGVTGRLLEDGVPTQAVKEVTIAAPMLEILGSITHVANDRRWLPFGGSLGGATTLVSEMTVAGS
ncbi:MAG: PmbA protein [Actinomycetota bacterium]|nr:PmbA protein [Actinomycetota bacterium]